MTRQQTEIHRKREDLELMITVKIIEMKKLRRELTVLRNTCKHNCGSKTISWMDNVFCEECVLCGQLLA